ncbi:MAG: ADP-ribose pyrophosphatase YjhB (NUDIX family) [Parasphingorhabdus sp.]|jgi:ADP-ribose pyrophosphatase YjhB (NUDIX family)
MNFCSQCGAAVEVRIPDGDNMPRYVCVDCGIIHYQNPKIVTGCIPVWQGQILLCRRAIEPRRGLWTIPAGFMENKETIEQGAARETMEEACAEVINQKLYGVHSIPHISQVYIIFRGELAEERYAAGEESLDVQLFTEEEIPWEEMAFPVVVRALKQFFVDRRRGSFPVIVDTIAPLKRIP